MAKQRMRYLLQTLSPIHVGCDEVYEPTGFGVDENNGCLLLFDPISFIGALSEDDQLRFSHICRRGTVESILEIYKFLNNHRPEEARSVKVCKGFVGHYKQVLNLTRGKVRNELNRFQIERSAFCPSDQRPYIPGSAVKGALRTAFLNHLADEASDYSADLKRLRGENLQRRRQKKTQVKLNKWLEEKLLGLEAVPGKDKLSKDPFRLVKVSDFMPVGDLQAKIVYAVNRKKKPTDQQARGPSQILESVEPGARFVGEIAVEDPVIPGAATTRISLDDLMEKARNFFGVEKAREDPELAAIGATCVPNPEDGAVLIRVGRHSGAESVTIRRYRDIKIMLGKKANTFEDHATTLWLASETSKPDGNNGLPPFGWAMLLPLEPESAERLATEEKAFQENRVAEIRKRAEKRNLVDLERQRVREWELEEKRKKEKERIAEEKRKAELEAMTPEERAIAELQDASIEEHRVYEIYGQLDGFEEENRLRAAQLLKVYWQRNNKWKKKNCSKKQWQKVLHIQSILGEI